MKGALGCVYAIRCKNNGRIYIGSTIDLEARVTNHFQELAEHRKARKHAYTYSTWQEDFDAFGRQAFEVYVLEDAIPKERLREREAYWADEYHARDPRYGYNARRVMKESLLVTPGLPPKPFN